MREKRCIFVSLLTLIPIAVASLVYSQYNIGGPILCMFVVVVLITTFIVYQQNSMYKGLWYKPSNVFLLSFLIVNFQYITDLVLGLKNYFDFDYPETVNRVAVLCSYGLVFFMVGYFISSNKKRKKNISNVKSESNVTIKTTFISIVQIILFALWIIFVDYASLITGKSYGGGGKSGIATYLELLFYCSTLTLLVIVIINSRSQGTNKLKDFFSGISVINWIVIGLYCVIRMFSGDRGPFLYTVLALFFSFIASTKVKVKLINLIIPIIGFVILMNLIGMARKESLNLSFGTRISNAYTEFRGATEGRFSEKTILPGTDELASSNLCNQLAINMVDDKKHPLHYGGYVAAEIIQCIPFVSSVLMNSFKLSNNELSSNYLMTEEYVGRSDLYQIGTTVIANSYFDFKTFGVILIMLICGYFFFLVDRGVCVTVPQSELLVMVFILLASMAIYIPRATFFGQLKNLVPTMVFFYINKYFFQKKV